MVLFKRCTCLERKVQQQEARIKELENIVCPVAVGHNWKEVDREPLCDDYSFPHFSVTYVCTRCLAVKKVIEL